MQKQYTDLLIDALLDEGFTVEEAQRLIHFQEKYEKQATFEITSHLVFARWLVEHGRLSDW